jgi:hypothetical protein
MHIHYSQQVMQTNEEDMQKWVSSMSCSGLLHMTQYIFCKCSVNFSHLMKQNNTDNPLFSMSRFMLVVAYHMDNCSS